MEKESTPRCLGGFPPWFPSRFRSVSSGAAAPRHELDITGRVEGVEEDVLKGENSLKGQAGLGARRNETHGLSDILGRRGWWGRGFLVGRGILFSFFFFLGGGNCFSLLASWLLGILASWLLGILAFWLFGFLAFWLFGFLALAFRILCFPSSSLGFWLLHPFIGFWLWLPASSASPVPLRQVFFYLSACMYVRRYALIRTS